MDAATIETAVAFISKNYSPLKDECRSAFMKAARLLTLERNEVLVKEGQHADKTYFIISGCARAFYIKGGRDITDWFAFENDFLSSINSFFLYMPSPHYIEVLEPSVIMEVPRDRILELSDLHPDFDRLGRIIVTKTMLQLRQRIASIQFETAQQKYENLLAIRPDITQRVPLTHIASYLGITLETLSRVRNPKNRI